LETDSVIRKFRITAADAKSCDTLHYNLDVIISAGYRVNSHRGTQICIWATQRLRNPVLFAKAYVEYGAVVWLGEIDLAPDSMYDEIKKHG
jgi:hypothetical protein